MNDPARGDRGGVRGFVRGPDALRLAVLVLVAVGVHVWIIRTTVVPARDGITFAREAYNFTPEPPRTALDTVREAEHPPGYPLAVLAVSALTDRSPAGLLLAAQVANALAGVLLVVPSYLLGRMLFGPNVGFAAALLFQVLPVPARVTSDALSEGLYLLVVTTALALAVWAVRQPRWWRFALCGLMTGCAYLVRPEGLLAAVAPATLVVWFAATRRWPFGPAAGRLAALAAGVSLLVVPYALLIGKLTNKPTGQDLQKPLGGEGANAGPLFAAWWSEANDPDHNRTVWGVKAVLAETAKGTHYVVGPLALVAVVLLRRRFSTDAGPWVLLLTAGVNLPLLLYLAVRMGYVSERHTTLVALIACQLTAAGLPPLAELLGRWVPPLARFGARRVAAGLLLILCAGAGPFALKPLHTNREGHKHAGEWLAARLTAEDAVVDPYGWAAWYSGRSLGKPADFNPPEPRVTYVILENTTATPDSRLPVLPEAKELAASPGARVVYYWPENVPVEQAKVHVWKVENGR